jgi:hypothetical protein
MAAEGMSGVADAGREAKLDNSEAETLMEGWLTKRALGKSRLGKINWKMRYFVLSRTELE